METRSKEEVIQDIEADRKEARRALRGTKYAWTGGNPAVRAWKATKGAVVDTKDKIVAKTCETKTKIAVQAEAADMKVRENIYRGIGIAVGVGALVGFIARKRIVARKSCCD